MIEVNERTGTMSITRALAAIPVADHAAAVSWWDQFFGRPADASPMPGLAEWHIGAAGGVQIVADS
jgi:hypothetical protein